MIPLVDAIVVGAGPGGATCARGLARRGLAVDILERAKLPRVKLCAGWVTAGAFRAAELDPAGYPHTLQPFLGGVIYDLGEDRPWHEARGEAPVCYGIVRSEFDHFLVERAVAAGATLREGCALDGIRIVEAAGGPGGRSPLFEVTFGGGALRAPLVVGAGGHFCPVARFIGAAREDEVVVVCHEREVRLDEAALRRMAPCHGEVELFGMPDGRGYGWVVRKGPFLNVGIGIGRPANQRDAGSDLKRAEEAFRAQLERLGRLGLDFPALKGHAYKLWDAVPRGLARAGVLLVGDAAGLAANYTGEGIRPAIESGTLAAEHGAAALTDGDLSAERCAAYAVSVGSRMGRRRRAMFSMAKLIQELAPAVAMSSHDRPPVPRQNRPTDEH